MNVGGQCEHSGRDRPGGDRGFDTADRLLGPGPQIDSPAGDLAGAAVDDDMQVVRGTR